MKPGFPEQSCSGLIEASLGRFCLEQWMDDFRSNPAPASLKQFIKMLSKPANIKISGAILLRPH